MRERTEELERSSLSRWATASSQSKGRERPEEADPLRTVFQVDRDRILHSTAFRRLHDKTHRFIPDRAAQGSSGYRSRLTHSLTAAQIGRTIARGLRANEDLVEAIALGADLGATPYGPTGEEALASMLDPPFRHEEQSLRVVETLEQGGRGLNLSWEVRDGIHHHSWAMPPAATWEGQIVRLATRIAIITHDLDDAFTAGIVARDELPSSIVAKLGLNASERVAALVRDVIETSEGSPEVRFSDPVEDAQLQVHEFITERVLAAPPLREQQDRALHVVRSLVVFLSEAPELLPPSPDPGARTEQRIVDYLSSLGDRAIRRLFLRLFLPGQDG